MGCFPTEIGEPEAIVKVPIHIANSYIELPLTVEVSDYSTGPVTVAQNNSG